MIQKRTVFAALAAAVDFLSVLLVFFAVAAFFMKGGAGNMETVGAGCFRYFTVDSNILAGLVALACLPFRLRSVYAALKNEAYRSPRSVTLLRLVGTAAVALTFLTVVFFLGPTQGYASMFAGNCLSMHLLVPLLSILSFVLFDTEGELHPLFGLLGAIPAFLYGGVYIALVIFTGEWEDFYGFNIGGLWYASAVAMFVAAALISLGLLLLRSLVERARK